MWRSLIVVGGVVGSLVGLAGCQESATSSIEPQVPSTSATETPDTPEQEVVAPAAVNEIAASSEIGETAQATAEPAAPDWKTEVVLSVKSWAETKDVIAAQRGKIVVVDVWSTACLPCLREFPHLIELQKSAGDDVVCIGLNCDFAGIRNKPPEAYRERVMKVLNEKTAHIINIMCNEPADELFPKLKIDSIPAAFVYDRNGQLVQTFDNNTNENAEFTYAADVLPVVQELIEATKTASTEEPAS